MKKKETLKYPRFISKSQMAEIVCRLLFGISDSCTSKYIRSLPQYKSIMRNETYDDVVLDFKHAVRNFWIQKKTHLK